MGRIQAGYLYEASRTFYARYYDIVDGRDERVQRSEQLCAGSDGNYLPENQGAIPCESGGQYYVKKVRGKRVLSPALRLVFNSFMQGVNSKHTTGRRSVSQNVRIADFWEQKYLPHCEEIVPLTRQPRKKPSTVRGYKQIWRQHLKRHFGTMTLREYEPRLGSRFLRSLTGTQCKTTLKHIKALGTAIFSYAIDEEIISVNPWHEVKIPEDAIVSGTTKHYTLEESENIVSALAGHVDCQLILALSCFLGLRPGEIAALRWEDFDAQSVHIRRSVVRGEVNTPKTPESVASLPLIAQVEVPLKLWRRESGNPTGGWVFESRNGTPVDLHNFISRVIVPHVEGSRECVRCNRVPKTSGVAWKTLYAGRRGACTAVVEATNGNYAVAQALLRHKSMKTTLDVYKKQITPEAFKGGMKMLEAAAGANENGKKKAKFSQR